MASIITATTTSGLTQSADNSGVLQLASGTGNLVTVPSATGTMALTASPTFTGTATIPTASVTTLNSPSGVLATQNGMTGIAKAWVNFNGASATIRSSFNCSSITRTTTGSYTMNFTTAMPSADFVIVGTAGSGNVYGNYGFSNRGQGSNSTTTATFNTYVTHTTNLTDCDLTTVAIFSS